MNWQATLLPSLVFLGSAVSPLAAESPGAVFDFEAKEFPVGARGEAPYTARGKHASLRREAAPRNGVAAVEEEKGEVSILLTPDDVLLGELEALTVSIFYKVDEAVSTPVYVKRIRNSSGNVGYFSFINQNNSGDEAERRGTFRFGVTTEEGGKGVASTESWALTPGKWNAVAAVFEKGVVSFYLNGDPVGRPQELGVAAIPAMEGGKGSLRTGGGYVGLLDDLVVLPNRALTPEEVRALHTQGLEALR